MCLWWFVTVFVCDLIAGRIMATPIANSWELTIQVDQREGDEGMKFKLRVKGDLHIGGLMLKLVEKISE